MMQVKMQSIDQIIEQRRKEFDEPVKEKSDDLFTIKDNLEIKVIFIPSNVEYLRFFSVTKYNTCITKSYTGISI